VFIVEDPSFGPSQADLVVPVPGGASRVSRLGVVEVRENALTLLEIVTLETFSTITAHVMSLALVGDGHADLVGVENPSVRAL